MEQEKVMKVSKGGERIMLTLKDELFPGIEKIKGLLEELLKCKIGFKIFSKKLAGLESQYTEASRELFRVIRKLDTPDLLFKELRIEGEYMAEYFAFQPAIQENIKRSLDYLEISDRILDRQIQKIQTNRTFLLSLIAIIASILFSVH